MAKKCGVLVELPDGNRAVIWNNEEPFRKKYRACLVNENNKETGEHQRVSSSEKLNILGFINK